MLTTCLSAACSSIGITASNSPETCQADDWATLVTFGNRLGTLDGAELEQLHTELVAEQEASLTADTAIKLSLLLRDSRAPFFSPSAALTLLERAADSDDTGLATLILHFLRQSESAVGDTSPAQYFPLDLDRAHLEQELIATREALATAQRERADLQQQLDALKAVEAEIDSDLLERTGR